MLGLLVFTCLFYVYYLWCILIPQTLISKMSKRCTSFAKCQSYMTSIDFEIGSHAQIAENEGAKRVSFLFSSGAIQDSAPYYYCQDFFTPRI